MNLPRRAKCLVVLVVGCLTILSACDASTVQPPGGGAGPTPPAAAISGDLTVGSSTHTMVIDGRTRAFRVYRPATLRAPAPLVVMLHGGGGSARGAEARYGWDPVADQAGFLVAYPEGVERSWNGGGDIGPAGRDHVDDVGFLTAMISSIEATVPVDAARVFATGISEGGIMSYRLACSTRMLAAIGPDSATELGPCPTPAPTSVIHIHGGADNRIPFDGRPGTGVNKITGGPIADVVAAWRAVDHCPPPTTTIAGPVHTTVAACPDGRAVDLIEIDGAGHQWPGSAPARSSRPRALLADPPSTALDATTTLWTFFSAHPKP